MIEDLCIGCPFYDIDIGCTAPPWWDCSPEDENYKED